MSDENIEYAENNLDPKEYRKQVTFFTNLSNAFEYVKSKELALALPYEHTTKYYNIVEKVKQYNKYFLMNPMAVVAGYYAMEMTKNDPGVKSNLSKIHIQKAADVFIQEIRDAKSITIYDIIRYALRFR